MSDESFDPVAGLLRRSGRGPAPSPDAAARIRAGVHEAWRAEVARRRRSRWLAVAASLLLVAGATSGALLLRGTAEPRLVARVTEAGEGVTLERAGAVLSAVAGDEVTVGDVVRIQGERGATLAVVRDGGRAQLRLAPGSRLRWLAADEAGLESGQLYLDIEADRRGDEPPLRVHAGEVRIQHVGTRFMTRIEPDGAVDVAVREGSVSVRYADASLLLGGGERALVRGDEEQRSRLAPSDPAWQWAEALAARVELEGRSLLAVLLDLTNEAGLELRFASPEVERQAAGTTLHGPPLSQPPRTALQAVIGTTLFQLDAEADTGRVTLRRR